MDGSYGLVLFLRLQLLHKHVHIEGLNKYVKIHALFVLLLKRSHLFDWYLANFSSL